MKDQFHTFVESLRNDGNGELIGTILEGYNAMTEAYLKVMPVSDRTKPKLASAVNSLEDAMNHTADIVGGISPTDSAVFNRVSEAIKKAIADGTYDGELVNILKDNFQQMANRIGSNPRLTSDKINAIGNAFDSLYNRMFALADAYGF